MSLITDNAAALMLLAGLVESAADAKVRHQERPLQGGTGGNIPEGCQRHDAIFLDGFLHGVSSALAVLTDGNGAEIAAAATHAAGGGR